MIKAIIADVDGVLVGKTQGFNFPLPNENVLKRLQSIHKSGVPVILCSAKSLHPLRPIIEKAHLDNLHIADGGAVLANPFATSNITTHPLPKDVIKKLIDFALQNNVYIELHALGKYFIQADQAGIFTLGHTEIMQQEPMQVPSLLSVIEEEKIIKIIFIVPNVGEKGQVQSFLGTLEHDIASVWTMHPSMLPAQFAILTAHGVSKKHGAEEIVKQLGISFDEVLGIGDTLGDWKFMQLCGYVAVVGDESEELKEKAQEKGEGKYFLAPSVEQNGILKALDYFLD